MTLAPGAASLSADSGLTANAHRVSFTTVETGVTRRRPRIRHHG
jgi:hypothetical protein